MIKYIHINEHMFFVFVEIKLLLLQQKGLQIKSLLGV